MLLATSAAAPRRAGRTRGRAARPAPVIAPVAGTRAPGVGRVLPAVVALLALAGALPPASAAAQATAPAAERSSAPRRAPAAAAVVLRLRPRAGDTLHLRFEQVVHLGPADLAVGADARGRKGAGRVTSALTVLSRSAVERSGDAGSVVVAITDSVLLRMAGAPPEAVERARRAMQGRRTRMRVAPDGAMQWLDGAGDDVRGAMGLPGTLPAMPVPVGATWMRTMPLPWSDGTGARGDAAPRLELTFRLDSLAADGSAAFLALRGRLATSGGAPLRVGDASVAGGSAAGTMRLDLARGWVVDSRADFALDLVPAAAPPGARPAGAMRLLVSQRLTAR